MKVENLVFKFFIIWYICGVILLSFDLLPQWLEWSNVMFLILAGLLACIYFLKLFGWKIGTVICSVIFVFSFSIEYLGAAFGVLFGDYSYTDRFTPNLFDVPIAICMAYGYGNLSCDRHQNRSKRKLTSHYYRSHHCCRN